MTSLHLGNPAVAHGPASSGTTTRPRWPLPAVVELRRYWRGTSLHGRFWGRQAPCVGFEPSPGSLKRITAALREHDRQRCPGAPIDHGPDSAGGSAIQPVLRMGQIGATPTRSVNRHCFGWLGVVGAESRAGRLKFQQLLTACDHHLGHFFQATFQFAECLFGIAIGTILNLKASCRLR